MSIAWIRRYGLVVLCCTLGAPAATAQITAVVVGVTPTCPAGLSACWPGAREGLGRMSGVESVALTPDSETCMGTIRLKHDRLPDLADWPGQFAKVVGEVFEFRGIEVTAKGALVREGDKLLLRVPGVKQPLTLAPLRNKLQWDVQKRSSRPLEPAERDAYFQLAAKVNAAKSMEFGVLVTGPLRVAGKGFDLEVRQFMCR